MCGPPYGDQCCRARPSSSVADAEHLSRLRGMTMGTNSQEHPGPRTRASKRDALAQGITGMVFALIAVLSFPSAHTWYLILGACIAAVAAVVFVARAIISLRRDDYATSEWLHPSPRAKDIPLKTGPTFWFAVAALCVMAAGLIFGGRTMLIENLGDPAYKALIISAYVLLGAVAGSLTKAFSQGHDETGLRAKVRVQDGATYSVVKRLQPSAGQRSHYWLGDNGQEIELTEKEIAELL